MSIGAPSRPAPAAGALRFARYAYPPNALGYCGPGDSEELLGLLGAAARPGAPSGPGRGLAELARQFDGAWPYLELIAGCSGIADPLDDRVVDAYWLGNGLLTGVPAAVLLSSLDERFGRRLGRDLDALSAAVPLGAVPHHSFHVFGVSPWLGMLRGGLEGAPLTVLDRCRIRWGTVVALAGDLLVVRSRALELSGHRLVLGPARLEEVRRAVGGVGALPPVHPGDVVSLHWDWACDRLGAGPLARLRHYTERTLRAVNASPVPGPAVACDRRG